MTTPTTIEATDCTDSTDCDCPGCTLCEHALRIHQAISGFVTDEGYVVLHPWISEGFIRALALIAATAIQDNPRSNCPPLGAFDDPKEYTLRHLDALSTPDRENLAETLVRVRQELVDQLNSMGFEDTISSDLPCL